MSPTPAWAAAALVSTSDDAARYYRTLFGGHLLSPQLSTQMETTVPFSEGEYGLGLVKQKTPCGIVWGHIGEFPGYKRSHYRATTAIT